MFFKVHDIAESLLQLIKKGGKGLNNDVEHATVAETMILDAQTTIPMPIYSFSCKIPHIIIQLSPLSPCLLRSTLTVELSS